MTQITIIDDSLQQMEILAKILAEIIPDSQINRINNIDNIYDVAQEAMQSDYIFCDYHFADTSKTGLDILKAIREDGEFYGKAILLSGDTIAKRQHPDYHIVSKLDIYIPGYLERLMEDTD